MEAYITPRGMYGEETRATKNPENNVGNSK
jgi:hypothetical protein